MRDVRYATRYRRSARAATTRIVVLYKAAKVNFSRLISHGRKASNQLAIGASFPVRSREWLGKVSLAPILCWIHLLVPVKVRRPRSSSSDRQCNNQKSSTRFCCSACDSAPSCASLDGLGSIFTGKVRITSCFGTIELSSWPSDSGSVGMSS